MTKNDNEDFIDAVRYSTTVGTLSDLNEIPVDRDIASTRIGTMTTSDNSIREWLKAEQLTTQREAFIGALSSIQNFHASIKESVEALRLLEQASSQPLRGDELQGIFPEPETGKVRKKAGRRYIKVIKSS